MLAALGKGDGGRVVVESDNKGRKTCGRERGEGDEGITKLKTKVISAAAERKRSFPCQKESLGLHSKLLSGL